MTDLECLNCDNVLNKLTRKALGECVMDLSDCGVVIFPSTYHGGYSYNEPKGDFWSRGYVFIPSSGFREIGEWCKKISDGLREELIKRKKIKRGEEVVIRYKEKREYIEPGESKEDEKIRRIILRLINKIGGKDGLRVRDFEVMSLLEYENEKDGNYHIQWFHFNLYGFKDWKPWMNNGCLYENFTVACLIGIGFRFK